ncbi:hypothetical protein JL720_11826 [Aureococcus anophagefferens]|nr:hypothetical protein JL720_11826 [Aureococcus anophagefferens]
MRAAACALLALAAGARADGHALTVDWKEFMSSTEQALTADHTMDIVFAWEGDYGDGGTHSVYMMPTKEAYDACDLSQIVTYAEARHGDDAHEASGFTISAQELAEAYGYDTPTYWICEVSDHCANAQKITITVSGDDEHADGHHDGDHDGDDAEEHDDHFSDGHDHGDAAPEVPVPEESDAAAAARVGAAARAGAAALL